MKKSMMIILGIVAFVGMCMMWWVGTYNGLVTDRENVTAQWKQVENQMQRRYDLIPNLVNTVQGYTSHEKEVLTAIADARSKMGTAQTPKEVAQADSEMTSALSRLMMVVENYPTLKADQSFNKLMDELSGTENRLAVARKDYNEAAKSFNAKIQRIPTSFIANNSGFKAFDYFEMDEQAKTAPRVDFSTKK